MVEKEIPMQVYIGIDWSEKKHDAVMLNGAGQMLYQMVFPHTPEGFQRFDQGCQKLGISREDCVLGMETAHTILIDFLWDRGYTQVHITPPKAVNATRGRFRQSLAHCDQSDARLIADMLRTDRHRWQPWHPDGALLRQMRAKVSLINFLTKQVISNANRLRAVLLRYYPAALQVFSGLKADITLKFIQAYPSPQAAERLSLEEFKAFAKKNKYTQPTRLPACYARLQLPQVEATSTIVQAYQEEAQLLAGLLLQKRQAKKAALRELSKLFHQHPDYAIFQSLPGAGEFLAPALLTKFGEDRQRFPDPNSMQSLAGTCPVTQRSGQHKYVRFRRACDTEFRTIAQQWAKSSLQDSVWANLYYQRVQPHCHSDSHAYRCLANRWLGIAWTLWQKRVPYNEAYHLQQRALRSRPAF